MKIGDFAEHTRTFTAAEVEALGDLAGPLPANGTIPEALIGALFSYLLGTRLPGLGTNYLKQDCRFLAAARIGEPLTARVEITRLRPEKQLVDLATSCCRADGKLLVSGRALVYIADVPAAEPQR